MKTKLGLVIFLLAAALARAQTNNLTALLQQGLFEEQANRNLDAAIADYQALARQFDKDRQLAATAIFRLGECYRMQNKTNEAALEYQRILRDFSDQTTLATLSGQNLTGMGMTPALTASLALQTQKDLLAKQIALAEQDLADTQRLFQTGVVLQDKVRTAEREVLRLKQQLAALDVGKAELLDLSIPVASEEDQEIARIQTMIQNSPDLINASGRDGRTPFNRAVSAGWLRAAGFLLDHGATLDWSALFNAASSGNKAMVEFLLERGADVNATEGDGATALHRAATSGFLSVAEVLIQHKANLEARTSKQNEGQTPLHRAATQGRPAMVALLAARGADVNARDAAGMTPIIRAALSGQVEVLDKLLKAGAKPDVEDDSGRTALFFAAARGNIDFVKALLAAKANPNAGKNGAQPLIQAVRQPEIVKLLLSGGASPNVKTDDGGTPLLSAIQNSQFESTALLVQNGADVNTADDHGMTPLHMAVWAQNIPTISLLLSNKADINVRHPSGRTALDMSKEAEHGQLPSDPGNYNGRNRRPDQEIARNISALLREHGALDNLPEWNRIAVTRAGSNYSRPVFNKGTNDWNHFTLLELLYFPARNPGTADYLKFPDLANIVIVRPATNGTEFRRIPVNLFDATNALDCTRDVPLEFGDVVEIPEREHSLAEAQVYLTREQEIAILDHFRSQQNEAKLIVAGSAAVQLPLQPFYSIIGGVLSRGKALSALTSSSDLSRVKLTRRDPNTGKTNVWILDCSNRNNEGTPELWLRGGDVIDVPGKP